LQELDLRWAAAIDIGGNTPSAVFLRCADLTLPNKENNVECPAD